MKKFGTFLFDLDGTLIDSKPGIIDSLKYALSYFGIDERDENVFNSFIGPPLALSFPKYYGFSAQKAEDAVSKYRERYVSHGIYNCALYVDALDTLQQLKARGTRIALATSKLQKYTEQILRNLKITQFFDYIQGADDALINEKTEVVAACLSALEKRSGQFDKSDVIMVGDRKYDIIGAKANGIMSIGVLAGYSDPDELRAAGADFIVERLSDTLSFCR